MHRRRRSHYAWRGLLLPLVLMLAALLAYQYSRPLPPLTATLLNQPEPLASESAAGLPWPAGGSAAVAVQGLGILGTSGGARPHPLASVTKIMTAHLILQDHPLAPGQQGPTVTVTAADVALYQQDAALGQSVAAVVGGEQLSEYQLLQGLLLPSSNNYATLLAVWDAGSLDAFVAKMNAEAAAMGMTGTHYADASGASAASTGIPSDLVKLTLATLTNPVFAGLVSQSQATLPVVGVVHNVDTVLGQDGIVGVKTGWTEHAGGCFVFAARQMLAGKSTLVVGAVLDQPTLGDAFAASQRLIAGVAVNVRPRRLVSAGQPFAVLHARWGGSVQAVAAEDGQLLSWPAIPVQRRVEIGTLRAPLAAGDAVGALAFQTGAESARVPLVAAAPIPRPSLLWRLTRH